MNYNLNNVFKDMSITGEELSEEHKSKLLGDGFVILQITEKEW